MEVLAWTWTDDGVRKLAKLAKPTNKLTREL